MGVNVEDGMVKNAASKLGCLVLKTPFTYLGTKVGGNMSRKQAWKEVVDKVLSRLSRWKMKLLSIGGILTLLKSVLGSMPIFHMSIFKVPSSILKSLESIRSRFFNGQDPKSNKASWWVWRFYSQKCSLWTKVIKAIYGDDGNLNKDVSKGFLDKGAYNALELNKNAIVSSKLNASSLDNLFRRKARSRIEEMQLNSLAEISRMTTLVPCEDHYVWTLESDGVFSVASIRKEIDGNRFQDVSLPTRWVKSVQALFGRSRPWNNPKNLTAFWFLNPISSECEFAPHLMMNGVVAPVLNFRTFHCVISVSALVYSSEAALNVPWGLSSSSTIDYKIIGTVEYGAMGKYTWRICDRRKEGSVGDKGSLIDGAWRWEWNWVRSIRGRVSREYEELIGVLQNVVLDPNREDKWIWTLGVDGVFLVRDLAKGA
ncbi:hypothetical protein Tco_0221706 [Tanacetum coccineum]